MKRLVKIFIPVLLLLGLALATGCAAREVVSPPATESIPAPAAPPQSSGIFKGYTDGSQSLPTEAGSGESDIDRKIIRTGRLTLEVDDIVEAMDDMGYIER